jgi:hypothetical protein
MVRVLIDESKFLCVTAHSICQEVLIVVSQHQWLDGIEDGRDSYHQSPDNRAQQPIPLAKGE